VGILSESEIKTINAQIGDISAGINYVPVMENGNKAIVYNKQDKIVYFVEDDDFNKCYKKQPLLDFKKSVDELKRDGWLII
jgi:hypothetical protein